jgi:hypothetical protein
MSLLVGADRSTRRAFLDPIFDKIQWTCVSADGFIRNSQGVMALWERSVDFRAGMIDYRRFRKVDSGYVRTVLTMTPPHLSPSP